MILHVLIVDDEEDVLESLVPGFVNDLARQLVKDSAFQQSNALAGKPLPASGRLNIKISATGYESAKVLKFSCRRPVHLHLHLCCEKGGSFRHALRLLKEQFFAVVVSDLRFADDTIGSRAGRYFIEDVNRRNPETFGILYSAYQKPDGFPDDRFIRKGSAANLGGEELLAKIVEGFHDYLSRPKISRFANELGRRGLVYQSDAFGATLRRLYDYADLYFGDEPEHDDGLRRPRPMLLIDGETGTGKTEFAALLHAVSQRRDHPFTSATCAQLADETFLRSALFGHVKGSFSGASTDRAGLVESTGKGILLLDDLHKLSDGSSLILHSFLDDGVYSHLGEDEVRRSAESAIVAAVETPRWEEIKSQQHLADSFVNRVEQLVLRIPPLRARPEDIELQAEHYTSSHSRQIGEEMELSPEAVAWLVDYGFPGGNSRRLRDFLKGVVSAHARVTDYLDVPELEEYAAESGMLGDRSAPAGKSATAQAPVAASDKSASPAAEKLSGWQARIVRLATKAIEDELELDSVEAQEQCARLFGNAFPDLWDRFFDLTRQHGSEKPMEIKLFDELFRYYAIFRHGNPAKAAREIGMKDNALREFVYSREQRRGTAV